MPLQEGSGTDMRLGHNLLTVILWAVYHGLEARVQQRRGRRSWITQSRALQAMGKLHETGQAVLHTSLQKYKMSAAAKDGVRHETG